MPLAVLATSLLTAILIFPLREDQVRLRTAFNLIGSSLKLFLVGVIFWGVFQGYQFEARLPFLDGLVLSLRVDSLSLLFVTLSAILWFLTTIYAIGYLEGSPHRSRFFGFFSLCVTATMGIALAGNLITFFVFYELLTVATYPLVVHRGTGQALAAGRVYLIYTLTGGTVLLLGIAWLHIVAGPIDFAERTGVVLAAATYPTTMRLIFFVILAGLGVKAALVPLHGWLPTAMVAPAPVSALLHAVAVVKAGVFGIARMVFDVYGLETAATLGVLQPLAIVASITIIYGSIRALGQDDLKRLLAYSTVSQLAYIVLGVAIVGPLSSLGGLVHLLHQGMMKITLFFCAGLIAETLGIHRISEMAGVGRRMPVTMGIFTVSAIGMIGIPPVAGFVTKWYLGLGGLAAGDRWVVLVLAASTLLTAVYFLPIIASAWFRRPADEWPVAGRIEASRMLLYPTLATGLLSLAAGVLAGVPFSPLWLATLVTAEIYGP